MPSDFVRLRHRISLRRNMKKYLIIIACVTLVAFMVALFSGCSANSSENCISDLRYGIFDGECEEYNASFVYGMREKPYYLDGVSNKKVEFGIITVVFSSKPADNETVTYSLKLDNEIISGELEKSPYSNEYMADVGKLCSEDSIVSLKVSVSNENGTEVNLTNKSKSWTISCSKAQELGLEALKTNIERFDKDGKTYEVYVKIISQQQTNFGKYYWNVSVVSKDGEKHSVLFSTESEDILVKN